jgi:hypothetical protein
LGGGGAGAVNAVPGAGTANTGGGGGATSSETVNRTGGAGGSGVVIIKYPDFYTATFSAGVTQSTAAPSGGFKVSTITATSTTSETVTFS